MYLTTINEIEHLHHYKYVEDHCKMPRLNTNILINCLIVIITTNSNHSTTANCTSSNAVVPFPLRMTKINTSII